ncbi:hypothetical protein D3C87_1350140 [compost metagenome]
MYGAATGIIILPSYLVPGTIFSPFKNKFVKTGLKGSFSDDTRFVFNVLKPLMPPKYNVPSTASNAAPLEYSPCNVPSSEPKVMKLIFLFTVSICSFVIP